MKERKERRKEGRKERRKEGKEEKKKEGGERKGKERKGGKKGKKKEKKRKFRFILTTIELLDQTLPEVSGLNCKLICLNYYL